MQMEPRTKTKAARDNHLIRLVNFSRIKKTQLSFYGNLQSCAILAHWSASCIVDTISGGHVRSLRYVHYNLNIVYLINNSYKRISISIQLWPLPSQARLHYIVFIHESYSNQKNNQWNYQPHRRHFTLVYFSTILMVFLTEAQLQSREMQ